MPVESIQWAILGQVIWVSGSSSSWPACRPFFVSTLRSLHRISPADGILGFIPYEDRMRCTTSWLHQVRVAIRGSRHGCSYDTCLAVPLAALAC